VASCCKALPMVINKCTVRYFEEIGLKIYIAKAYKIWHVFRQTTLKWAKISTFNNYKKMLQIQSVIPSTYNDN